MVYFDTLSDKDYVRILKIRKDPKCPVCSEHPTQTDADRLRSVLRFRRACQRNGARGNGDACERGGVGAVTVARLSTQSKIWFDCGGRISDGPP